MQNWMLAGTRYTAGPERDQIGSQHSARVPGGPLAGNVQVDRDGGGHDCKCIRDGDQASPARDGWTGQPLLIALSIPAFVVMIHEFDDASGELHLAEQASARGHWTDAWNGELSRQERCE